MKEKLCIDVVRAGTYCCLNDTQFKGFRRKINCNQFYIKNVKLPNGTVITLGYYLLYKYLTVECSLPKVVYGNNYTMLTHDDTNTAITIINAVLKSLGLDIDFRDLSVSNVEISYNYICSSEKEKKIYIDILNKRYVSRRNNSKYDTSAVQKNKSRRTTAYDKLAEVIYRNHDTHLSSKDACILRLEHKVPKRVLNKYKINCTVRDLFNIDLREVLKEENRRIGIDMKILNKNDFYKALKKAISGKSAKKQDKIIKFYSELNEHGELYVKQKYSRYVFITYRNIMLQSGFCPVHTTERINNIIDFQRVEETSFIQRTKQEIKNFIKKVKGESKTTKNEKESFMERMVSFKPFCLLCKFFNSISESYFNTS